MKFKIFALFLAMLMFVSCAPTVTPDPGANDPTQPNEPTEPSEPSEPTPSTPTTTITSLQLISNGQSDYTIVYDDSDAVIVEQVASFVRKMKAKHGVVFAAVAASEAEPDYEHEIVVGNVRPSAQVVAEKLNEANDFAMCIEQDDWVMIATESRLYKYLFAVVDERYVPANGMLNVNANRDFIYHKSSLKNKTYLDYIKPAGGWNSTNLFHAFEAREFTGSTGKTIPYRLYIPYDYDPNKEYPLLLVLHGAGERGVDNTKNMGYIIPNLFNMKDSPATDAIIVCPQCPEGNQWVDTPWAKGSYSTERVKISDELQTVMELLDELYMEFTLDINRHYVMGLSMGGFGTWDLLMRYPDFFAAGIPICGGADPSMAERLVDVPIWTFHGSVDDTVPVSGTREMAAAMEATGSTVFTYEEFEGANHGIWGTVASRRDVIEWLFSQDLGNR